MPTGNILVADDDAAIRTVLNQALARAGYEVRTTGQAATLWTWAAQGEGDLIITDVVMPDGNAFDLLPRIKRVRPELPIIVMSAQNTFMTAIKASERGAYEYLPKPFDLKELVAIVGRALSRPRGDAPRNHAAEPEDIPLVGRSPAMQDVYRALARLMPIDLTVMINGESGTGKELVARALHDYGKRRNGPFVAINMAAIPKDLIESELFGHEKGAFTGATDPLVRPLRAGRGRHALPRRDRRHADGGADAPAARAAAGRVHHGRRAHADQDQRPHRRRDQQGPAHRSIAQGLFREDLFFRLNVVPIRLPPLRERVEDIPDLVRHFFALVEKEGLPRKQIDSEAMDVHAALSLARQCPRARKSGAAAGRALSAGDDHGADRRS
jgi:two-component system nitrogen regulation response regulator GlnG